MEVSPILDTELTDPSIGPYCRLCVLFNLTVIGETGCRSIIAEMSSYVSFKLYAGKPTSTEYHHYCQILLRAFAVGA